MGAFDGIIIILFGLAINAFGIYLRKNPTSAWRMNEGWKIR